VVRRLGELGELELLVNNAGGSPVLVISLVSFPARPVNTHSVPVIDIGL